MSITDSGGPAAGAPADDDLRRMVDQAFEGAEHLVLAGDLGPSPTAATAAASVDPADFASLYIRYRASFGAHARRFLRDPRDVDEVVQEAFLRLFLALPELGTELQALAYCRRTLTNLCIDRYRADKRRPRLVNIEAVPADEFAAEDTDDPVIRTQDAKVVRDAMALLTPLHRDVLVKREIEEKSFSAIAQELGISETAVKHMLHRARRALRRHLASTPLAPGADFDDADDDVSTLSLLARSAASGGDRKGDVSRKPGRQRQGEIVAGPSLEVALNSLDDQQRAVLQLFYDEGFDWYDISKHLHIPERQLRQVHRSAVLGLYQSILAQDRDAGRNPPAMGDVPDFFVAAAGDDVTAARLLGMGAVGTARAQPLINVRLARTIGDMTRVINAASRIWDPRVVPTWLRSRNAHLGGARPIDVLYLRGGSEVLDALSAEAAGAFA